LLVKKIPSWLEEFKRRTLLISAIEKAYTNDCDCEVCSILREAGETLGELFMPPAPIKK